MVGDMKKITDKLDQEINTDEMSCLKEFCNRVRLISIEMVERTKTGHIGSAFSIVEILSVLYNRILSFGNDSNQWHRKDRDRFVLSKGHGALSLYATLALKGFLPYNSLDKYLCNDSFLTAFPNEKLPMGLDFSSGSLGHGLSVACGMAYGLMHVCSQAHVYVLLSDGECQEGSTWEAAQFAGHHDLHNLIAIVDVNKLQAMGKVKEILNQDNLSDRFKSFGFHVVDLNGHDTTEIYNALIQAKTIRTTPTVILAHTIKGKGISFMENKVEWHYLPLNADQAKIAKKELMKDHA